MKVLVVMPVNDTHKNVLESVVGSGEVIYKSSVDVSADDLADIDIIVGNIKPELLSNCKKLKLLQLNSAGTDGYTAKGVLPEGALLANATGSYGLAIAEHMIGALLCMMKKIDKYRIDQENHFWSNQGMVTSIYGSRTLVVGLGDIGSEFAVRMNSLGSKVDGIRRTKAEKPEYIDNLYQMDKFYDCLKQADIVAACLPNTKETYKLFDEKAFSCMKEGAYFINVGRGNAVDTDSLYEALESDKLAGASVDVTDPEPLPADHKLWDAKNILITPHISGGYHLQATHDKIVNIAANNIRHLVNGEPFENLVDMTTGYRATVS